MTYGFPHRAIDAGCSPGLLTIRQVVRQLLDEGLELVFEEFVRVGQACVRDSQISSLQRPEGGQRICVFRQKNSTIPGSPTQLPSIPRSSILRASDPPQRGLTGS